MEIKCITQSRTFNLLLFTAPVSSCSCGRALNACQIAFVTFLNNPAIETFILRYIWPYHTFVFFFKSNCWCSYEIGFSMEGNYTLTNKVKVDYTLSLIFFIVFPQQIENWNSFFKITSHIARYCLCVISLYFIM